MKVEWTPSKKINKVNLVLYYRLIKSRFPPKIFLSNYIKLMNSVEPDPLDLNKHSKIFIKI